MNKKPEITAATRQRIIEAFWTLYKQNEISQIRIKEITDIAKINRSTFYQYFKDIFDILLQEEQRIIDDIVTKKDSIKNELSLKDILSKISEVYIKNGEYICVLTSENGDPKFCALLKDKLLAKFEIENDISHSLQSKIIFNYGLDGLLSAFRVWFIEKDQMPLEDFLSLINQLVHKGIFYPLDI